jgi:Methuselah N-terminus
MTMTVFKAVLVVLATTFDSITANSCNLLDTVRIDGDYFTTASNDDLQHNGVTYSRNQWTYYNKDWALNGTEVAAEKHVRGCFCEVRDCIRLCCPLGQVAVTKLGCVPFDGKYQLLMEVTDNASNTEEVDLVQDPLFNQRFIFSKPCMTMFNLAPAEYDQDEFTFHTVSNR